MAYLKAVLNYWEGVGLSQNLFKEKLGKVIGP